MIEENELPKLPEKWVWTNMMNIIIDGPQNGLYLPQSAYGTGIPILRIDDFQDGYSRPSAQLRLVNAPEEDIARYGLRKGDLIINRVNSPSHLGKCLSVSDRNLPSLFESNMMRMKLSEAINVKFVALYLCSSAGRNRLISNAKWAVNQASINQNDVNNTLIPFPPTGEQHRIVTAIEQQFTRLDAAVTALQHAKTKLKRYRAAVLKAAVEGKLTEAWRAEHPATEPASALLERILDERRAKWEADLRAKGKDPAKAKYVEPAMPDVGSLSRLPEGWCWATLNELSWHVTSGSRGWAQYYAASGSLFVRVGNFNRLDTNIDLQNVVYVRAPNNLEADRCRLQGGDLLITITADVGMVGIVDEHVLQWGEAFINQHVGLVRFVYPELTVFVALALTSEPLQAQIRNKQYGATKTGLNLEDLKSFFVPLPPVDEQHCIYVEVEHCLSQVQDLESVIDMNLKRAERLRQSILKEAFAGALVPQDPHDEPSSVLLDRIHKEREEQKRGSMSKQRTLKNISVPKVPDVEPVDIDANEMEQMDLWTSTGSRE